MDGAISTSGSSPGGSSTSSAGGSHISGPTTCAHSGHARGYSNCGNVPTSASSWLVPPWLYSSGPNPNRARVSFSSTRPRSTPRRIGLCARRHILRPTDVRGNRAPSE
ncbi:MAG TPA: hypothetical protein VNY27_07120 [Solirubrobacteraceae bacterium]|nr:hypothetical protein [Solirubrobacteraceae bacterium]